MRRQFFPNFLGPKRFFLRYLSMVLIVKIAKYFTIASNFGLNPFHLQFYFYNNWEQIAFKCQIFCMKIQFIDQALDRWQWKILVLFVTALFTMGWCLNVDIGKYCKVYPCYKSYGPQYLFHKLAIILNTIEKSGEKNYNWKMI